jgi:NAD-dependent SIR2 family protein deacetylase
MLNCHGEQTHYPSAYHLTKRTTESAGSFATASCIICKAQFPGSAIEADVFAQQVPLCPLCTAESDALALASSLSTSMLKPVKKKKPQTDQWNEEDNDDVIDEDEGHSKWWGKPIIKPDIVFFGENLSDEFDRRLLEDREKIDLLIVIGTSLRVCSSSL